jgi:phenylpyruvate tautomerase
MPYMNIKTNLELAPETRQTLIDDGVKMVSGLLGKPERYTMVALEDGLSMQFDGDAGRPLAFVELKSIGLPERDTERLSAGLGNWIEQALKIPVERVYIVFANVERHMWGWKRATF